MKQGLCYGRALERLMLYLQAVQQIGGGQINPLRWVRTGYLHGHTATKIASPAENVG